MLAKCENNMNCTIQKTTTTSAKLKKLLLHVSNVPVTNSLKRFTKPKKFLTCSGLFSLLCSNFFVKLFFFQIIFCFNNYESFDQVFSYLPIQRSVILTYFILYYILLYLEKVQLPLINIKKSKIDKILLINLKVYLKTSVNIFPFIKAQMILC